VSTRVNLINVYGRKAPGTVQMIKCGFFAWSRFGPLNCTPCDMIW